MVDAELGLAGVFNGCLYNYKDLREELARGRLPLLLRLRYRGACEGLPPVGAAVRRSFQGDVRLRGRGARYREVDSWPGPAGDQAALPHARRLPGCASPLRCPPCWPAGGVDTDIDKTALHHYMTFHSVVPPPLTILTGVQQAAARHRRGPSSRTGATFDDYAYWRPGLHPWPMRLTTGRVDGGCARGVCVPRWTGGWWPTCQSACCCPAGWTPASSWRCSPRQGRRDLQTFSIGFADAGGRVR